VSLGLSFFSDLEKGGLFHLLKKISLIKHANFEKINLLGSVIKEVQEYQKLSYNIKKQQINS